MICNNDSDILQDKRLDMFKENGALSLTPSQARAVLDDGEILVSASAGSGKTSTLVKRILRMLVEGFELRKLLVCVYNESAAAELKEKLHDELFKRACLAENDAQRQKFSSALDSLPFCRISTIHAYCYSLVRENFEKLGLSPSLELLTDRADVLKNEALESVFNEYFFSGDPEFAQLAEIFSASRKDDSLKKRINDLFDLFSASPDRESLRKDILSCFDGFEDGRFCAELYEYYKKRLEELDVYLRETTEALSACKQLDGYLEEGVRQSCLVADCLKAKDLFSLAHTAATAPERVKLKARRRVEPVEMDISDRAKHLFEKLNAIADELAGLYARREEFRLYHAQNGAFVRKMLEVVFRFAEVFENMKRERNAITYQDMLVLANRLLEEHEELRGDFDAVFVDEYQDVDEIQEAIFKKLINGECFIVGDVKQSIYGFRGADPRIFISRRRAYEAGRGEAIEFDENFRSDPRILQFVNDIFDVVMTKDSADVDYVTDGHFVIKKREDESGEEEAERAEKFASPVQLHFFTAGNPSAQKPVGLYDITSHAPVATSGGAAEAEGKFIAAEIKRLAAYAKDANGKGISYGDMAILVRSSEATTPKLIKALKDEGIPLDLSLLTVDAQGAESELVNFLKVIDNPRQDIPLAGFLLSFFGGYLEQELATLSTADGDCLYDRLVQYSRGTDSLAQRAKKTLGVLREYRTKASFKSASELAESIISDYAYDAYLARFGAARVRALRSFFSSKEATESTLGEFLEVCGQSAPDGGAASSADRVQVSTFHKFKGQERDVVFVANVGWRFNSVSDDFLIGDRAIGLPYFDLEAKKKKETLSMFAVKRMIREKEEVEEMRLFYVALTRAKRFMYLTSRISKDGAASFGRLPVLRGASSAMDYISKAIYAGKNIAYVVHEAPEEIANSAETPVLSAAPDEELVQRVERMREFEYPYKEATSLAMKYSVSALDSLDDQTERAYPEEAAAKGVAYHKVMQLIDYNAPSASSEIERMVSEGLLDEKEVALVDAADIDRCLASDIIAVARKEEPKGNVYRERAFMMLKPASEVRESFNSSDEVLVQGIIDLYIDGEQKIVVDFKSSSLRDEEIVKKYKKQLYLYKMAIESADNVKIDRVLLYSFKTGETIDLF